MACRSPCGTCAPRSRRYPFAQDRVQGRAVGVQGRHLYHGGYGPRAPFHSSDTNPFGSFYGVEPAEGGSQVVFVADDTPSAPVEFIGANVLFCD